MSKIVFKVSKSGLRELRQSKEVQDVVNAKAEEILSSHPHHHIKSFVGFDRAKAILYLNTKRYPS